MPKSRHRRRRLPGEPPARFARRGEMAASEDVTGPRPGRTRRLLAVLGAAFGSTTLVLATLALVVELGAARRVAKPTETKSAISSPTSSHTRATSSPAPRRTMAYEATRLGPHRIQVYGVGGYKIDWSFRCPAGHRGDLTIEDQHGGRSELRLHVSGKRRWGVLRDDGTGGYHRLLVFSNCHVEASVVLPPGTTRKLHRHDGQREQGRGHNGRHRRHTLMPHHWGWQED